MSGRQTKKIVESDSEEELDMNKDQLEDEEEYSMDEEDVDDELQLPKELISSVTLKEKRELLQYKRTHSELEWENEMLTRIENLSKKKDMERLKQMTAVAGADEDSGTSKRKRRGEKKKTEKKPKAPSPVKKYAKGREKKRYVDDEEDDFEDEEGFEEDDESQAESSEIEVDDDEDDESDDLFDEEEINTISKQTKALKKASMAKKKKATATRTKKVTRKRSRLDDYDTSGDESDVGEDDWGAARSADEDDEQATKTKKKKKFKEEDVDTSEIALLEDILKIQSRRVLLEKWHTEPYFADVVTGSVVRYCVGHTSDGTATYRMAEVLDVVPMKPYKLPDTDTMADKGLLIAIGSKQNEAKMYKVSNSRITQREYDEWMGVLEKANETHMLLRKKSVEKRRLKIREASQHTYTHEEIESMIQKNSINITKLVSNYSHAMDKLKKDMDTARNEGDFDTMEKIQKEMDKLDRETVESRKKYAKTYEANTNINRRNKERNIKMDMEAGIRKREMDMKKTKEEKRQNPFARRETRPTILWVTGQQTKNDTKDDTEEKKEEILIQEPSQEIVDIEKERSEENEVDEKETIEQIGKRIEKKFGFNPHLAATLDKRAQYLAEECKFLPALESEARNEVRQGISLSQYMYMQQMSEQIVGGE